MPRSSEGPRGKRQVLPDADNTLRRLVGRFVRSDQGLTVTEYAVAAGLLVASLTVTFLNLGLTIDAIILAVTAFM